MLVQPGFEPRDNPASADGHSPNWANQAAVSYWFAVWIEKVFFLFSAIPFIKNPEQNVAFEMYFQRAWQDTFFLSLYNFLITLFHHMHILYQLWGICNQTVVWYILNQNPDLNPSQKRSSFSMRVTSTRNISGSQFRLHKYEATRACTRTAYWQNHYYQVIM